MKARDAEATLARQLRTLRLRFEVTQQDLADRLKDLGSDLSYAALSKIESGKRRVSLNEMLELAAALRVNPDALYVPLEKNAPLKIGRHSVLEEVVRDWISPGGAVPRGPWITEPPFRLVRSERDEEARDRFFQQIHSEQTPHDEETEKGEQ